ncbi:hypothetical protein [Carboxylicivirga sp. M1479]|uniref:hypothetical protein n=1 Tax=Carboxylicivirga sp. M1479 TaxID=2594476 RepID=UPI001178049D|nr:hypothetical protein [Carboxylicivirga sp. M1479]TRX66128.1 hypothetical protein FNN09_15110 [Carboxylicivirga sp. M1479]
MKNLAIITIALLATVYTNATEKIKVYSNPYGEAPVVSILDGRNSYDQLIVKDVASNKVISETDISGISSYQERLDLPSMGINTYTVELRGEDKVLSETITVMNNKVIHDEIMIDENGFDNMKFFVVENGSSLIMSHHTDGAKEMNLVIVDREKQKKVESTYLGNTTVTSYKTDISNLKKETSYRATLYSGSTAYHFDFVR